MAEIVRLNWCEFPFSLSLISFFYTEKDHEMSDYCYLSFLSGWDKHSYGYHGDDGHSFCSSGTGQPYGPTFTTGDVIGCCVNLINNTCFYTKNGHSLGNRAKMLPVLSEHKPAEYAYTIVMTFWLETYWTWKAFICFVCLVLVDVHLSFFFFFTPSSRCCVHRPPSKWNVDQTYRLTYRDSLFSLPYFLECFVFQV